MVNRVILVGNLTADPEVRATPKGVYVANLRMATNTYAGKDEAGEGKEKTEFHRLVVFGRQAEIGGEYLRKGRLLYVEGWAKITSEKKNSKPPAAATRLLLAVPLTVMSEMTIA